MQVDSANLSERLCSCPHFSRILKLCAEKEAYLVGGAVRDALLSRPLTDLDLIFPDDPTALAKSFARQIDGHWFWLDKERLQSRVVGKHDSDSLHYDFAIFRAPDLERDLLDRDFTVNALALPLNDLSATSLVDPVAGLEDLKNNALRMVGAESLANDPLRIIKGIRHATILGMEIEADTQLSMHKEVAGLDRVAPERVRQEFWKILQHQPAERWLLLLCDSGVGAQLFGAGFVEIAGNLGAEIALWRRQWQTLAHASPIVKHWLGQELEQGLTVEGLLLFTFMLSSIAQDLPTTMAERWRLSRRTRQSVAAVSALDRAALEQFINIAATVRACGWWASRRRLAPELLIPALGIVAAADPGSPLSSLQRYVPLAAQLKELPPKELVDGMWLQRHCSIKPGAEMAEAFELLRDAEIDGSVESVEEARAFLLRHYN